MDSETAKFTLNAIAAGALLVWLLATWFTRRAASRGGMPAVGEVEVAATPDQVIRSLTAALSTPQRQSPFGSCVIDEVSGGEVRWHQQRRRHVGEGVAQVVATNAGSRVTYRIAGSAGLIVAAKIFVVLGAVAILTLYTLLDIYAVPSEELGVRGQVVQMVQCVHFLWPPFMLAGLANKMRSMLAAEVERTVMNARFVDGSPA